MVKKLFLVIIFLLSISFISIAQVPQIINLQGYLTDASNNPLNGVHSIEFKIYDNVTGGTAIWSETQSVTVTEGVFSVLLGTITPISYTSVFDGDVKYLSIKVGSDPEMTPRKKLVSVGYSFRAYNADKVDGKDASSLVEKSEINSISTDMIQDNAVALDKIIPSIVSSVDGVTNDGGNIDLVAGGSVTITPDDANNRITISATTGGGDNLGNHTATENIKLNNHWLSGDGGNQGVFVTSGGAVGVNYSSPSVDFEVNGDIKARGGDIIADDFVIGNGGVKGIGGTYGVCGQLSSSVYGYLASPTGYGVYGKGVMGVYGAHSSSGCEGYLGGSFYGAFGVKGQYSGYLGGSYGVYGRSSSSVYGYIGGSSYAIAGYNGSRYGMLAAIRGVEGYYDSNHWGYIGSSSLAGYFKGNVSIAGTLSKSAGSFKIDHPLDPANKYLFHSFVESPDMKNVYDGVVVLNGNGEADVSLPDWFDVLNKDFRYQLTAIGAPGPNLYIAGEISNNSFKIAGGTAGMKVSWQVTGIRDDAYARTYPMQVEVNKEADEIGKYLHPEVYGFTETMSVDYAMPTKPDTEEHQKMLEEHERIHNIPDPDRENILSPQE